MPNQVRMTVDVVNDRGGRGYARPFGPRYDREAGPRYDNLRYGEMPDQVGHDGGSGYGLAQAHGSFALLC